MMTLDLIKTRMLWGACILGILLLLAPGFHAACINDPADKPEDPCPELSVYTGIQASLSPDSDTIPQCCENPPDSEMWSAEDWAAYFNITATATDQDKRVDNKHELQIDEEGRCTWELVEEITYPPDSVYQAWSGAVNLTELGEHHLICTFSNIEAFDGRGCPVNAIDEPVVKTFTLTVVERPMEESLYPPLPSPSPWEDFVLDLFCSYLYQGTMRSESYAWIQVGPTYLGDCADNAAGEIEHTISVSINAGISVGWKGIISLTLGVSFNESVTTTILADCPGRSCKFAELTFYQRHVHVHRIYDKYVYAVPECVPVFLSDEDDYVDGAEDTFCYHCRYYVGQYPGPPDPPQGF